MIRINGFVVLNIWSLLQGQHETTVCKKHIYSLVVFRFIFVINWYELMLGWGLLNYMQLESKAIMIILHIMNIYDINLRGDIKYRIQPNKRHSPFSGFNFTYFELNEDWKYENFVDLLTDFFCKLIYDIRCRII